MPFQISSTAFDGGGKIPSRYTCDGENISPPLQWRDAPKGTKSFALVVEDPDAPGGTYLHWGIYDIGADTNHLHENIPAEGSFHQTHNHFGNSGYGGPCPPVGHAAHHYNFRLFALDVTTLNLADHTQAEQIEKAAQPHLLGMAETTGLYAR